MVLTAGSMFQGYHTLVPVLNSILRDGIGTFKLSSMFVSNQYDDHIITNLDLCDYFTFLVEE